MRKVFLDDLPRFENGSHKGHINWQKCIGKETNFTYDNTIGIIKFNNYNKKNQTLDITYLNNNYNITTGSIINCALGNIIGIFDFKYSINQIVKTNMGEVKILEQLRNHKNNKIYKYKCLKCPNIDIILESDLISGKGCNVCCPTPRKVLIGYNDIATTKSWMIEHMVDKNDAYKYTYGSGERILFKCKDCGQEKLVKIHVFLNKGIQCPRCGDGISYPNKFAFNLLQQLNINFESEYSPDWLKPKRYDFYFELKNKGYALEMDGELGHGNKNNLLKLTTKETKKIDNYKDRLAKEHGIEVIRIDCKKSELEYIRNNILHSKLVNMFDLGNINWNEIEKFALLTRVKEVCDLWNSGIDNVAKIHHITKLSNNTIVSYLKKGTKIGWCKYDSKLELAKRSAKNNQKRLSKPVMCIETGTVYNSTSECDRLSEKDFGVKLFQANISLNCRNGKPYKGFHFKYINENNYEEKISNNN